MIPIFETLRVTAGRTRLASMHATRLARGGASHEAIAAFFARVDEARRAPGDFALRVDVTDAGVDAIARPLPSTDPVDLVSASGYDPSATIRERKTVDRAWAEALEARAGDALPLLVSGDGLVGETTRTNVFAILGDRLVTPPIAGILPGVTRWWVTTATPVDERPLTLDELTRADAAFVTSALRGVVRVRSIDGRPAGDDPRIAGLARAWGRL